MDKAILCVDDEAIILIALKQELRRAFGPSFLYETARNGEEALEVIDGLEREGVRVLIVISDWYMPGMNGDELFDRIHEKYPGIATILVTGQMDEKRMQALKDEAAIQAIIRKPWQPREMLDAVSACLGAAT